MMIDTIRTIIMPRKSPQMATVSHHHRVDDAPISINHPTLALPLLHQLPHKRRHRKCSIVNAVEFHFKMLYCIPSIWAIMVTTMYSHATCAAKNAPIASHFSYISLKSHTRKWYASEHEWQVCGDANDINKLQFQLNTLILHVCVYVCVLFCT